MSLETAYSVTIDVNVSDRFRGYLPVVVDVETAGFNAQTDALLEVAAVLLTVNDGGEWVEDEGITRHIQPFEGANLEKAALDFNGIDPEHPFRKEISVGEKEGLQDIFKLIRSKLKAHNCKRAILVGHNPAFDIGFLNAAVERTNIKRNPFHPFSTFDTATLGGLAYGQTVLSRAVEKAGIEWDSKEAHSARYDAERTAELFCKIVNRWRVLNQK
ncbi:MAG: ribonuclease T [Gammaproteobacteria bacterium]|nr:ribonuclease T [Gammaproteobacteria bacterium]